MKAAQIVAPRKVELVDVEEPCLNGISSGMIKVKVERACLCGSDSPKFDYDLSNTEDLRIQRTRSKLSDFNASTVYPLRPGQSIHECLGTVVESTSSRFKEGDFVLALPQAQSGLCEYFCTQDMGAIRLPRDLVAKEQILMSQPLGTVVWACQKLGNLLDLNTVVVGQGPMGLLFSHMLSNLGARTVIAIDKLDYRLEVSKRMKATHTIQVDREDPILAVQEVTGGKMADLVFEVVGHQTDTIGLCMKLVRRLGTLVSFGVPDETIYKNFPYGEFFGKNLTLIGSVGPDVVPNFSLARDMIAQSRIDVTPIITHVIPFQEIQQAYELFVDRKDKAVKVVLNYETLRS